MTNQLQAPASTPDRIASTDDKLCVVLRCDHHVVAIPVKDLIRLVSVDEAKPIGDGVSEIQGRQFASWDLGTMLGLSQQNHAWILCEREYRGEIVPLALRTGKCIAVLPINHVTSFPSSTLERRVAAFDGVFAIDGQRREFEGAEKTGLRVSLSRLWSSRELGASLDTLAKVRDERN